MEDKYAVVGPHVYFALVDCVLGVAVPLACRCMNFVLALANDVSSLPATALSCVFAGYVARVDIDMSLDVLGYLNVGAVAAADAFAGPRVYFDFVDCVLRCCCCSCYGQSCCFS